MYIKNIFKERSNWFFPKNAGIKIDFQEELVVKSNGGTFYLIYGDNNGLENPPLSADKCSLKTGTYQVEIKGKKDLELNVMLYILTYDNGILQNKYSLGINEKKDLTFSNDVSFKIVLHISGSGNGNIESIWIKSIQNEKIGFDYTPINSFLKILPKNLNGDYKESAERVIKNNIFTLKNFGSIQYPQNINWEEDFGKGRSYLRLLNGFVWLGDIVKSYEENNNLEYVEKALTLIYDWIEKNPYEGPTKKMTWHDETTALRLLQWVSLYNSIYNKIDNQKTQELLAAMKEHAVILSKDEFYAGNNNHGMFQNFAILVYSYLFNHEELMPLITKAKARLQTYFDFIISSEGIHKEHTPVYHYLIASNLKKYGECFASIDKEFSEYLLNKYNATLPYSIHILKPNGYFPQIGDNNNVSPKEMRFSSIYNSEEYKFAITAGEVGTSPKQTNVVYQNSGYAIFRDSWAKKSEATYILFNAAYHTGYHKHSDDLSFILYSGGDIFIDSGPNGYEYANKFTKYGYSSFAHNTLIVDNEGLPRVDNQFDKTNITAYSLEEEQSEVTGVTSRYMGVTHERTLRYDHMQTVHILDTISSDKEHEYCLLFHLAGDITPVNNGQNIVLLRNNDEIANMKFQSDSEIEWEFVYGEENEEYVLGWHFKNFNTPEKNYVIKLSFKETNARVETIIELNNKKW